MLRLRADCDNLDSGSHFYALSGQAMATGPDNRTLIPAKPDALCHHSKKNSDVVRMPLTT